MRQAVNEWIRQSAAYDGVIDFDAVVRDPQQSRIRAEYDGGDHLHPNDAGYKAMGDSAARWSLKNDVVIVGYEVKPAAMFVERTRADKLDLRRYRRQARCFPDLTEPVRSLASAIFSRERRHSRQNDPFCRYAKSPLPYWHGFQGHRTR